MISIIFRFRTGLNPLVAQLEEKKTELRRFDTQIQERRSELQRSESDKFYSSVSIWIMTLLTQKTYNSVHIKTLSAYQDQIHA